MFEFIEDLIPGRCDCGRTARIRVLLPDGAKREVCKECALTTYGFCADLKRLREGVLRPLGAWYEHGYVGEDAKSHVTIHYMHGREYPFFLTGSPEDVARILSMELPEILRIDGLPPPDDKRYSPHGWYISG